MELMTLGQLVDAQQALKRAYGLKIKDGRRVIRVRRTLRKINDELQEYGNAVDAYINEHGKTGEEYAALVGVSLKSLRDEYGQGIEQQKMVGPAMPEYPDYVRYVSEMRSAEVDLEIPKCLSIEDFDEISAAEIDQLESIGILAVDDEPDVPESD